MASHSLGMSLFEAGRQMGVPFVEETEPLDKFVQVHGLNFHYLEWGNPSDPTIFMLHGNSQQAHSLDFFSFPLYKDYHVIALDQRGHGDSDWAPDGDYSLEAQQMFVNTTNIFTYFSNKPIFYKNITDLIN